MFLTDFNVIRFIGTITKGVFEDVDPSRELYKIENSQGTFYAVTEFMLHDATIPSGVEVDKWCYTENDGFYRNPNWHTDPQETIEAQVTYTAMMTDTLLPNE